MLYNRIMGTSPKGYSELFQPLLEQINWNPSILPYQNIVPSTNPPDRLFHQQFLRCPHIPPDLGESDQNRS
ncbi:proS [Gossypium arboreum]|uniref:ProS n=1 Tax=Gossypium arboreum TaxID=29729 RepID=A0A0B0NEB8_GOSAR|nr:proS [Gossypium arboreum]